MRAAEPAAPPVPAHGAVRAAEPAAPPVPAHEAVQAAEPAAPPVPAQAEPALRSVSDEDRAPSGAGGGAALAPAGPAVAVAAPEPEQTAAVAVAAAGTDVDGLRSLWPAVAETLRPESPMVAALAEAAVPVALVAGELRLGFARSSSFLKRKAEDTRNRVAIAGAVESVVGERFVLAYELVEDAEVPASGPPQVSEDEWVARFVAEFNAEEIVPDDDPEGGA